MGRWISAGLWMMMTMTFDEFKSMHKGKNMGEYLMQSTKSGVSIVVLDGDTTIYHSKKKGVVFLTLLPPYPLTVMEKDVFEGEIEVDGRKQPRFCLASNNDKALEDLFKFKLYLEDKSNGK